MNKPNRNYLIVLLGVSLFLGCDRSDGISTYSAPKQTAANSATPPASEPSAVSTPANGTAPELPPGHPPIGPGQPPVPAPPLAQDPAVSQPESFSYTPVAGWKLVPSPASAMIRREATFIAGSAPDTAEVTALRMGPAFDLMANLNRWRGQVGLPPVIEPTDVKDMTISGHPGQMVDVTGPEKEMIVALVNDGQSMWFFKILGPAKVVSQQRNAFTQFVNSIKLNGETK